MLTPFFHETWGDHTHTSSWLMPGVAVTPLGGAVHTSHGMTTRARGKLWSSLFAVKPSLTQGAQDGERGELHASPQLSPAGPRASILHF